MSQVDESDLDAVDVALVAFRDDGDWIVQDLDLAACESVETIAHELRRYPNSDGAIALIAVDEDFCLLVRSVGHEVRVLISDVTAAEEWELARTAVAHLGYPVEHDDDPAPAGDLAIVADLGLPADEMGELLDDDELFPDEILSEIAEQLGFGDAFDDLADLEDDDSEEDDEDDDLEDLDDLEALDDLDGLEDVDELEGAE